MNTVVTSILTSAGVSLFTFVLGLKSGKNQADRAFLQGLYKQLYAHFSELEAGLIDNRPKKWEDYKSIQQGNRTKFYPPVREMQRTGDILYLNKRIADQAIKLEVDCLSYRWNLDELCMKVHEHLVQCSELFKDELVDESFDKKNNPLKRVGTSNSTGCRTYRNFAYGVLLNKEKLIVQLNDRDASDSGYALDFTMKGNPPKREFILYPESLAVDNETFAKTITEYANSEFNSVAVEKELLKRIEKIKKKIAKRAKNPTGFWETFAGAFIDIFY